MRFWFLAVFMLGLSFSGHASDLFENNEAKPHLVIKSALGEGKGAIITAEEFETTTPQEIKELLQDPRMEKADVLLSTDQPDVVNAATEALSKPNDKRLLRIIPIGKLASASQKIASGFKAYYSNVKNTLRTDRIGLTVLSITVGYDSFIWIHSASLDIHQKTAMLMMNFVMAATFGLDRDLWSKINTPIKTKLIRVFDHFGTTGAKLTNAKILAAQYFSNLLLGVGVQVARTGLLSLDHIAQAVTTTDFWMHAVKISGLVTLTAFTWSEMYGAVESERNPVAKLMLKRLGEMRGIVLSQLASISMVLQPALYGHVPTYTYIVHGAIGLLFLMNMNRIVEWLENSPTIIKIYKKIQTFENFINSGLAARRSSGMVISCESLFAG